MLCAGSFGLLAKILEGPVVPRGFVPTLRGRGVLATDFCISALGTSISMPTASVESSIELYVEISLASALYFLAMEAIVSPLLTVYGIPEIGKMTRTWPTWSD